MKKFITLLLVLTGMVSTASATKWYLVGEVKSGTDISSTLFPGGWSTSGALELLYYSGSSYVLSTEVTITESTKIEYKLHDDGSTWVGNGENNFSETLSESGTYKIFIEYNGSNVYFWTWKRTTASVGVVVAGDEGLLGVNWDGTATENAMSTTDNIHYTLNLSDIYFPTTSGYQFKVYYGGDAYAPASNYELGVAEIGYFDITISYDAKANSVSHTATRKGYVYTVAGNNTTLWGSPAWSESNTDNDMTTTDYSNYTFVKTAELAKGDLKYKVVRGHSFSTAYGNGDDGDGNTVVSIPADGTYAVKISFNVGNTPKMTTELISNATVTVGAKGYATYCNADCALDFTGKSIQPYVISSTDGSALTLTNKKKVAKNEPVLLYSSKNSDSQNIPVIADGDATAEPTNKLVKGTGTALTWSDTDKFYVLMTSGEPGFYKANNNTVAETKAYLDLSGLAGGAHSFTLDLEEGNVTGIANVSSKKEAMNGAFYNLAGQKVAQPTKGLYIMNGKKVIIK